MHVYNCFWDLHMMCVLVAARHTANIAAQLCKIVSCLSKCVLTCGHNCKGKGHHVVSKGVDLSCLVPGEVET